MEYILYKGEVEPTYHLLHCGEIFHIPFSVNNNKAHKLLAKQIRREERNVRFWKWIWKNELMIAGILFFAGILVIALLATS